jgi:hypothetical protein
MDPFLREFFLLSTMGPTNPATRHGGVRIYLQVWSRLKGLVGVSDLTRVEASDQNFIKISGLTSKRPSGAYYRIACLGWSSWEVHNSFFSVINNIWLFIKAVPSLHPRPPRI